MKLVFKRGVMDVVLKLERSYAIVGRNGEIRGCLVEEEWEGMMKLKSPDGAIIIVAVNDQIPQILSRTHDLAARIVKASPSAFGQLEKPAT